MVLNFDRLIQNGGSYDWLKLWQWWSCLLSLCLIVLPINKLLWIVLPTNEPFFPLHCNQWNRFLSVDKETFKWDKENFWMIKILVNSRVFTHFMTPERDKGLPAPSLIFQAAFVKGKWGCACRALGQVWVVHRKIALACLDGMYANINSSQEEEAHKTWTSNNDSRQFRTDEKKKKTLILGTCRTTSKFSINCIRSMHTDVGKFGILFAFSLAQ